MSSSSMNLSLSNCVSSLRLSSASLQNSIEILDHTVQDFPRVTKVLQSFRHFELTSNMDILSLQSSLHSEIAPEFERLLHMTETYLSKLERQEKILISKSELQEGRLERVVSKPKKVVQNVGGGEDGMTAEERRENAERMKMLMAKKERLTYAVERFELEVRQKERMGVRRE